MSIMNAFHSEIMTQVIRKCALWVTGMHFSYDFTILNGYIKWSQQISLILVNGYSILSIPTYYTIIYGLAQFWEDDEHMGSMNIVMSPNTKESLLSEYCTHQVITLKIRLQVIYYN